MTAPAPLPLVRGRLLAFVGIALVALTMRTAVGALSPILDHVGAEIPLDHVVLAIIAAAPPLIFGLAGVVAPLASRFLGLEGALLAATLVGGAGHLLRALAGEPVLLVLGTVIALLGAGSANVLLPPIVKRYFPDRIGVISAIYITVMSIGATVPPAVAVPVADSAGWRVSLGMYALVAVIAALPWIWQAIRHGRHVENLDTQARGLEAAHAGVGRRVFRSPTAWAMAFMFAAPTMTVYAMFAWLPAMTTEISGVTNAEAGLLLSVFAVCGIPAALIVPVLAQRLTSVIPILTTGVACFLGGYAGFLFAPAAAPFLWTLLVGLGPLIFPLTLTLINLRTRTGVGAVALSGFVQGFGYVLGALGPLVVGVLHDLTGGWTAALWTLVGTMLLLIPAFVVLRRKTFLEDEVQPR